MTSLETLSIFIGIISLAIFFTLSFNREKGASKYFSLFLLWLIIHISLSLDHNKSELINRVIKSDKVYYLKQYKQEDLILDKEAYDKLNSLGNGGRLYISQSFWVVTINSDNKEEKYIINNVIYDNIINNKQSYIYIEYDMWGNKSVKQ